MTAGRSFRKMDSALLNEPDLSSDLDDEPAEPMLRSAPPASGKGRAPAAQAGPSRTAAVAKRGRPEPDDDDDVGGSLDYESDGELGAIVQKLMDTAAKRTKMGEAKLEAQAQQQREASFKEAGEKLKEAKAKHDAEWAACVAVTEKKVAASLKKLNDGQRAFEADVTQLQGDLRKAIKNAKAAAKESSKELDDVKSAQTRVLRSHDEALTKIVTKAEETTRDLGARQLDLGGILREIGLCARAMEGGR